VKPKQSLVHRHPWLRTEQPTIFQAANFLFVFTIGLQLGPGFLAALRQQGLVLNALAVTVVALGALTAPALLAEP
jgi:uncharacterized transporter YbjL